MLPTVISSHMKNMFWYAHSCFYYLFSMVLVGEGLVSVRKQVPSIFCYGKSDMKTPWRLEKCVHVSCMYLSDHAKFLPPALMTLLTDNFSVVLLVHTSSVASSIL